MEQAEDAGVSVKNPTIHSILVHFPDEPARRVPDLKIRRADHWPEHQVKLRCHPSLRSLISQIPTSRRRQVADSDKARMAKGFISIAEMLLLGSRPPRPDDSDPQAESRLELRRFFREQYKAAGEEEGFSRKGFLTALVTQAGMAELEPPNESMGTIENGRTVPPLSQSAETLDKTELEVVADGTTESLGTIDDVEFDLPTQPAVSTPKKKKRFPWH